MKLIMSPTSPFVRKVRVLIREANLLDAVTEVEVATTPMASDPVALAANPTGKIPALLRSDGPAIFDSRVITRFLDDYAGGRFYPQSRIWEVLTLEAMADAIMDAAVTMTYEVRMRPESERSPAWIEAHWAKVDRAVLAIEERWLSHLSGPLDITHIGVGCALSYLDLRHDSRGWRNTAPSLAQWHAEFSKRDSMVSTTA